MNGPTYEIIRTAAAMHGELKKMFLAAGILALFACICWGVQEWGVRKSAVALGWFGIGCLALASGGALVLISLGLL
jgi:hypothetical protein